MKGQLDLQGLDAGFRVLRRHLRYARGNPRKLFWVVRRVVHIVLNGELRGVLQRHRVVAENHQDYSAWIRVEESMSAARMAECRDQVSRWSSRPRFSVLMPVHSPSPPFLKEAVESVREQVYPEWELCVVDDGSTSLEHVDWLADIASADPRIRFKRRVTNGGIAVATNTALEMATGDYCVFLDQDDRLARTALLDLATRIVEREGAQVLYADEDRIDSRGARSQPFFKPDWDPEWLRTTNYVLHPLVLRTDLLRRLGGLRTGVDGAQDWDLLLRAAEAIKPDAIEHVPRVLYHWREHAGSTAAGVYEKAGVVAAQERVLRDSLVRRGERARVHNASGCWRIAWELPGKPPLASIVICTRDKPDLLRRCLAGLRERTAYPRWEAVVVDNGSRDPAAVELLDTVRNDPRFTVVRDDREFNYSALCNAGVAAAAGDVVVLLNNDVEPIDPGWLTELVSQSCRREIGLVGALLYYPDDTIQHAGVVLGLNGIADRPYIGYPRGFRGVDNRLLAVHTVTGLITACAAVRRTVFDAAGGMDETLAVDYNDVDLCLRIADLGLRNLLTPVAQLYHYESASRGYHDAGAVRTRAKAEEARFLEKWKHRLARDPAYNPNLSRSGRAYSLGTPF